MDVAVGGCGKKVGVAAGTVAAGSGVLVGAGVEVNTLVGVEVAGYSASCSLVKVGKLNSVGVTVGVGVPSGKKLSELWISASTSASVTVMPRF